MKGKHLRLFFINKSFLIDKNIVMLGKDLKHIKQVKKNKIRSVTK
jgi:hypothetical protein